MIDISLRFWVGGTGTWDQASTTHWASSSGGTSGASVPTASDDVIFDANSGTSTVTISTSAPCNSLASSGSSLHSIVLSTSVVLTVGSATAGNGNIAIDFSGFTSGTFNSGASISLISTSATTQTITSLSGASLSPITINGAGSHYQVSTAFDVNGTISLLAGTLDTNSVNCTWLAYTSTGTATRTLTLGSSTITVNGTSTSSIWQQLSTGATVNASSSTIAFTKLGVSSTMTITFNAFTYGTVTMAGAATNAVTWTSTGTIIGSVQITGPLLIKMSSNATKNVTNFWARGTAGNLVTLQSTTNGTQWTISKTTGTTQCDYISLQDALATGGATFYAGANSTNVSNNTGWTFSNPATQTASLSSTGTYGPTTTKIPTTAALTPGGVYGPTNTQIKRTASLALTGSFIRGIVRTLVAASLTFAGAFSNSIGRILKALSATLSLTNFTLDPSTSLYPSPSLFPGGAQQFFLTIKKPFTAALISVGSSISKVIAHGLTASVTLAGSLTRRTARAISATISLTGLVAKRVVYPLIQASFTMTGTMLKRAQLPLSAAITSSGLMNNRVVGLVLSGILNASGVVARNTNHGLNAALSLSGQVTRITRRALTAALALTGNTLRTIGRPLSAALSNSGFVLRTRGVLLTAALNTTGNMRQRASKIFIAIESIVANFVPTYTPSANPPRPDTLSASQLGMGGTLQVARYTTPVVPPIDILMFPSDIPSITLYPDQTIIADLPDLRFTLISGSVVALGRDPMQTK